MYILTLLLIAMSSLPCAVRAQTVSTITLPAAPQPTSPSYLDDSTFRKDALAAHNFYRKEHNATALVWNDTLATNGTDWSAGCSFEHSGMPMGENLAAGYPNTTASIDAWGHERVDYNFKKPGFKESTGHFTQMVWRNTTSVGCGRTNCDGRGDTQGWYVVCEYYPAGNVVGDDNSYFRDNVLAQTEGQATDSVETGVTSAGCRRADEARMLGGVGVMVAAGAIGLGIGW